MRRSKQTAKRAVYFLFPHSLSEKKQADREARGFVKGAYFCVRDRRQNASATKVCAAYSLSKPKGAYFCVSYRRQNASATKVLRRLFTFTNSGLLFSRTRRNKQDKERAAYSLFPFSLSAKKQADREARGFVKGAYSRVRDRRQNAKATQYCEVYSRSENKSGVSERKEPILLSHRFFIHL